MVFRTIGSAVGAVFATLFTAVTGFGVAVAVLAASGPISLAFLNPQIREALSALELGVIVQMDDTELSWQGWDRRLDVRIIGLRFIDNSGKELSRLPSISFGLNGKDLLAGDLTVSKLEAFGPKVRIYRDKSGTFRFGLGEGPGDEQIALALLAALGGDNGASQSQLNRIEVLSASVQINDELQGLKGDLKNIDLLLERRPEGVKVVAGGAIEVRGIHTRFRANTIFRGLGKDLPVHIDLTGAKLGNLVTALKRPEFQNLEVKEAPIVLSADLVVDGNGRLVNPTANISIGAGTISWPETFWKPLQLASFKAELGLMQNSGKIEIRNAETKFANGPTIKLTGVVPTGIENFRVKLRGSFGNLPLRSLPIYWPKSLGTPAWHWVRKNMTRGMVTSANFSVDIKASDFTARRLPARFVNLNFNFRGLNANYFAPLTQLTSVRGKGRLTANDLKLVLPSGRIGKIKVAKGKLSISNFAARAPLLHAHFTATAPTPMLLKYLDVPTFSGFRDLPFQSGAVTGQSVTEVDLKLPLSHRVKASDLKYIAKAELVDLTIRNLFQDMALEAGKMRVSVDHTGTVAIGKGRMRDLPVNYIWRRKASEGNKRADADLTVKTILTETTQKRFGLDLGKYLQGDLPIRLKIDPNPDGSMALRGRIDLTPAKLQIPTSGWVKKIGRKGRLSFSTTLVGDKPMELRSVKLEAGGLKAEGSIHYGKGGIDLINITKLLFKNNNLSIKIDLRNKNKTVINIGGKKLDARKFIENFVDNADTGNVKFALGLKMNIAEVLVADNVVLSQAVVLANWRNGAISGLTSRARVNHGAPFSADLRTLKNGHRSLDLWTGDGGAVLHGLGFFDNAKGGKLRVRVDIPAKMSAKSVVKGSLRGDDFLVAKAKILGRVLSEASLAKALDKLSGDGVRFSRVDAPFEYDGNRILLKEARAVGPSLGVTLRGLMYQDNGKLDLQGTIIPAYTLNSFLGKIPFIGPFLIGGDVGGLFALTYRIKGTSDTPDVSVNPLSALAPGFFRRIIEGFDAPIMDGLDGTKPPEQSYPQNNAGQN